MLVAFQVQKRFCPSSVRVQINGAALSKINLPSILGHRCLYVWFCVKISIYYAVAFNTGLISVAEHRDSMSLNLEVASTNDSRD